MHKGPVCLLLMWAWVSSCSPAAFAATLTTGFTHGITEGHNQNRKTVVGTSDADRDAVLLNVGPLQAGDVLGLYGRVVQAVDLYEFEVTAGSSFVIAFDLDGYSVYAAGKSGRTVFVPTSGLVNQSDLRNGPGRGGKTVRFSLSRDGKAPVETLRTANVLAGSSDMERILFKGSDPGIYRFGVNGQGNGIPALYDINITTTAIPLPGGIILLATGLTSLFVLRSRNRPAA